MKPMILALTIIFLIPISCGDNGGGGGSEDISENQNDSNQDSQPEPEPKNLFSAWALKAGGFVLDLTGVDFGTSVFGFIFTNGELCAAVISIGGTQTQGTGVISGSSYVAGTGSGFNPGCARFNGTYEYTKTSDILSLCQNGICEEYI